MTYTYNNEKAPMNASTFVQKATGMLGEMLEESGAVLYSTASTLRRGDLYVLGLNPGGGKEASATTIRTELDAFATRRTNHYVHEDWNGKGPGQATLQRRVRWMLCTLGYATEDVCASNLIFTRSRGQDGSGGWRRAAMCWPLHELVLDTVRPRKAIITFGKLPFDFVYQKAKEQRGEVDTLCSGHSTWACRAVRLRFEGWETTLIGIPHLSRYDITTKEEVPAWMRSHMGIGQEGIDRL